MGGDGDRAAGPSSRVGRDYRYDAFATPLLWQDLRFGTADPGPGDRVPDFDLPTVDGGRFSTTDLGGRPLLMVFGSRTCPVTESSSPRLDDLHAAYGDRVRFVMVSVREAHPGERIRQPHTAEEKLANARMLVEHHALRFEVAVDHLDGRVHRAFGPMPNSAYLIAIDGTIRSRVHWASNHRAVELALEDAVAGRRPRRPHDGAMLLPLLRAIGHLPDVVRAGGRKVERDMWRAAPHLALLGRGSRLFWWLARDRRGPATAAVFASLLLALLVGATRRRR